TLHEADAGNAPRPAHPAALLSGLERGRPLVAAEDERIERGRDAALLARAGRRDVIRALEPSPQHREAVERPAGAGERVELGRLGHERPLARAGAIGG